jgi:signal transduction histidine kinase
MAGVTHSMRVGLTKLADGSHLLVGRSTENDAAFMRKVRMANGAILLLIGVLAAVASITSTRRTVGRIESINATSQRIMEDDLARRIPLRGTRDEWDKLAQNLNSMLDRIETLMQEMKEVTDNVAHDLRTPLTRIYGRLERARNRARLADEDQVLINDTISDLDDVLRIFSSLMRISQIETSNRTAAFRTVNLVEIASDVVELFDAAAEDRHVRLSVIADSKVFITGDRDLLFDAFANLVDNAIKHGREGGVVAVAISQDETTATVAISDDGPGIPSEEFPNLFRRFYRLERSRRTPGNGLGLSLVAAIARLHGARIDLSDNNPGAVFRLTFVKRA